jgi:transposase
MNQKPTTKYTNEFKKQIVELYFSGVPVTKLSSEYGLIDQTIYKWIKLYSPAVKDAENPAVSNYEYRELQKKIEQLEMENEILKKATAIFARKL